MKGILRAAFILGTIGAGYLIWTLATTGRLPGTGSKYFMDIPGIIELPDQILKYEKLDLSLLTEEEVISLFQYYSRMQISGANIIPAGYQFIGSDFNQLYFSQYSSELATARKRNLEDFRATGVDLVPIVKKLITGS